MGSEGEQEIIRQRVMRFTAEQLGVRVEKLSSSARFLQDLGMDGDDAVEFFEKFEEKFRVDLHDLHANWELHFGPEGRAPSLVLMVILAGGVTAGFFLRDWAGILPAWGWAILLIGVALVIHRKWFYPEDTHVAVRIDDLLESVRLGRWSRTYPSDSLRNWR